MDYNRSEVLIYISLSRHCSTPNNVQIRGGGIYRHTGLDNHFAIIKSSTLVQKCKIIPSTTFSPDDNPTIDVLYTKMGLVREEHVASISPSLSEML
ncbi:uncharacterized protein NPIL_4441 [Nephila pilipes]|uniref:Uncharacterized protein n=1 Tax=Nephila pilipes TaxID=299642 RepID=A0A8X6QRV0_NEPPI|nr:uncharacterized protein NPIL_4441 [Nephila pilipes]